MLSIIAELMDKDPVLEGTVQNHNEFKMSIKIQRFWK